MQRDCVVSEADTHQDSKVGIRRQQRAGPSEQHTTAFFKRDVFEKAFRNLLVASGTNVF